MKKLLGAVFLLLATPIAAQVTVDQSGNVKPVPPCVVQADGGTCLPIGNGVSLPVALPTGSGLGNSIDATGTGSLALGTANTTYVIPLNGGRNTVGLTVNGLTGSGATITVERSNDGGTTWTNANTTESSATSSLSPTITANGQARVGVAGATNIRLRVSTAGTGTATVAYDATTAAGPVFLTSLLPSTLTPGTGVIGGVNNQMIAGATISVGSGTTDAGTQRVSLPTDGIYAKDATLTNGTQTLLNQQSFLESTTNLAAGGAFVGTVRTAPAWANTFVARAVSNVPGTIRVGVSLDGTTSNSVAAGIVPLTLQYDGNYAGYVALPITAPAANLRPFAIFVNGSGSATNSLTITSAFSASPLPNGDTAGSAVVVKGSGTIATGQVSVGTTAILIRAADPGRTSITVIVGAANGCAFGNAGVTTTTGYLLPATAGATDTTATSAALYGVCSATTTVSYKAILP